AVLAGAGVSVGRRVPGAVGVGVSLGPGVSVGGSVVAAVGVGVSLGPGVSVGGRVVAAVGVGVSSEPPVTRILPLVPVTGSDVPCGLLTIGLIISTGWSPGSASAAMLMLHVYNTAPLGMGSVLPMASTSARIPLQSV